MCYFHSADDVSRAAGVSSADSISIADGVAYAVVSCTVVDRVVGSVSLADYIECRHTADEAVTAALVLLPTPVNLPEEPGAEMEENDLPSTLETADDGENDETVAAVRGISTVVPSQLAPRTDIRGGAVVDWVVGGWGSRPL